MASPRLGAGIAAVLLVAALATPARAEVESELVQQGVAAYDNLEFDRAVELLNRAVAESLTRDEKIVAFRTLAFTYAALGRADEARGAFARLIRLDGKAELDRSVAPRVRALFEEARALVATGHVEPAAGGAATPTLRPQIEPAHPVEGQAVSLRVASPGGLARSVRLYHRVRGALSYTEMQSVGQAGRFELTIPGSGVRAPALELYLTAFDEGNVAIARAGTLAEPLRVDVAAAKTPARKRAWIWGVVAGAVVAGGVATALALTLPRPDSKVSDVMLIAPR
jgi:tetratricopeptide (TPR) repeat protein